MAIQPATRGLAPARMLVTTSAMVAACVVAGVALVHVSPAVAARVSGMSLAVAVGVFLAAGALWLSHWHIVSEPWSGWMGAGMVVVGGSAIPLTSLGAATPPQFQGVQAQVAVAVITAVTVAMVWAALHRTSPDVPFHPLAILAIAFAVVVCACAALVVLERSAPTFLSAGEPARLTLQFATAGAWLCVAALGWRRRGSSGWAGRAAPLLAAMGVVILLNALARHGLPGLDPAAVMLVAAVAVLAGYGALLDLLVVTAGQHVHLNSVEHALDEANLGVSQRDAWREELSHDARNAIAGIRAALRTLERYGDRLDLDTIKRLRSAALGEVDHLAHLVERSQQDQPEAFDVGTVIRNVVLTRRAAGLDVRVGAIDAVAVGRVGDLATTLQNLLVNAAQHAPGASVHVEAVEASAWVRVRVKDYGPGVDPDQAQRIFDRGVSGPDSMSTGLGLFVARQLMREQGGDLELVARTGGCTFVATLPAAAPVPRLTTVPHQSRHGLAVAASEAG